MTLASGVRLGSYEVIALLGAGGMGEVYQARDSKLGRDVAIKVLPEVFVKDPERLARFEREARLLALLSHSNIAAIHGLEDSDSTRFLVLELVPGETLAQRLSKGPLEIEDALKANRQIAGALEAAHEKGIIHRDLKPSNIKVTADGRVKVLDFGLAKAFSPDDSAVDAALSPTLTMQSAREGVILGTAAYMSPEQARGKPVDRRTDVWAFGCVLYECLTGRQAFGGETVTDTIAAVVNKDPDWKLLPAATPANIRTLLRHCLHKDRNLRLHDVADARIEIDEALARPAPIAAAAALPARRIRDYLGWALAAIFLLGMLALAIPYFRPAPEKKAEPVRFLVSPPEKVAFYPPTSFSSLVLSPDGRHVAFVGLAGGRRLVFLHSLASLSTREVAGTEGAFYPFWSPDSKFIGFFAESKLKKIEISGGPPVTLCDVQGFSAGGAWNRDGVIVFGSGQGTYRVSAAGGTPSQLTSLDSSRGETFHRWPYFLPDGQHFLYTAQASKPESQGIYVGSLGSQQGKRVLGAGSIAAYSPPGYLLFMRDQTLMAQSFDASRLEILDEPFPLVEGLLLSPASLYVPFSVSENGVLAYVASGSRDFQLAWLDRRGAQLELIGEPATYRAPALSPDETKVAVERIEPKSANSDIWLIDLSRRAATSRFTFDASPDLAPLWSLDGSRILFSSRRDGSSNLYQKLSSGVGSDEIVLKSPTSAGSGSGPGNVPTDWSRDGRYVVYNTFEPTTRTDIWVLPLFGDRKPFPFLQTEFIERGAKFSPDGRWIAYATDETSRSEIYVQSFPLSGGKWQVSVNGGDQPAWRGDGRELFFLSADRKLMSAEVRTQSTKFEAGIPKPLFQTSVSSIGALRNFYCSTADGKRFLLYTPVEQSSSFPITVVLNWTAELQPRRH